jgi:hypothetical protein
MKRDRGMYVEVGSDVGRAGNKGLIVNAPVWGGGRGCYLPAYTDLPLTKCAWKEGIIVPINDLIDPLDALQLLVET